MPRRRHHTVSDGGALQNLASREDADEGIAIDPVEIVFPSKLFDSMISIVPVSVSCLRSIGFDSSLVREKGQRP